MSKVKRKGKNNRKIHLTNTNCECNQMYLSSSTPMFLQLLVASHNPVNRKKNILNGENVFELIKLDNLSVDEEKFIEKTIENYHFLFLDIKKWRIVHTFVVYKNVDL